MALFEGEEMVPVQTPDGRTITVPRSLAGMAPQQIGQTTGGFTDETVYNVNPLSDTDGNGDVMTQDQIASREQLANVAAPIAGAVGQAAGAIGQSAGQGVDQAGAFYDNAPTTQQLARQQKEAKAQAAYNASPEGKQAGVQKQQDVAQQGEQSALLDQATIEGAEQDVIGHAVTKRNEDIDKLLVARNDEAQKNLEAENAKMNEIASFRKKIASTKIDRTLDHPVLAAIGVALSGIGSAMKGEKDTSLDLLFKVIDRKVAAQMDDLDQMGKIYGMSKDELAELKEKSKSRLEFHNGMIAGELDKAVRNIEEITARSASEKTKARAKVAIAQLQQKAAEKQMDSVRWGLEYNQRDDHQRRQLGLGYAQLNETKRNNMEDAQLKRESNYLDYQKYLAGLKASGDEASYKAQIKLTEEVGKRGIRDMNGDLFLTPDGRAKMAQAAQLEKDAAALEGQTDPMARSMAADKIALLKQKASMLRGDAQLNGAVLGHNDTESITVSNMIASGQSTVQLIDGIKDLAAQAGRGAISRNDAQVKVQAMFQQLAPNLKEAWQLGAWDKGSAGLVASIIGADPSSEWNAGALATIISRKMYENPNSFRGRLDSVADGLERAAKNRLTGLGVKFGTGDKVLQRATTPEETPVDKASQGLSQGRTGVEMQRDAENTGVVGKTARAVGYPFSPSHAQEAEQNQSTKYVGLSKQQEPQFDALLQAYKGGDAKAGDELIAKIANEAQKRPELAVPLLQNLQEHASKLYPAARAAIPKGSETDNAITSQEMARAGAAVMPLPMLKASVIDTMDASGAVTDQAGMREIISIATNPKHPAYAEGKKALMDIVSLTGARKTLPPGSVFRGGK